MENRTNDEAVLCDSAENVENVENVETAEEQTPTVEEELFALHDKYLRQAAEFDNYKKRTAKEKQDMYDIGIADVVNAILPALDNLERAMQAETQDNVLEGVKMIEKQFKDILAGLGVETIEALNCDFDPQLHNAVMHVDDENIGANQVVEQFAKGYKLKDRVIRYCMVKVAN